jgi:hypothetical protein
VPEASAKEPMVDHVEYTIVGGKDLGGGIHRSETALRIDLMARVAVLEQYQPSSDEGGEALGSFKAEVPQALCEKLRVTLARRNLSELHGGPYGGPGTSMLRIRATSGTESSEVAFSNRDGAMLTVLRPLIAVLDEVQLDLSSHPLHAITLEIKQRRVGSGIVFDITLENVGIEPVSVPGLLAFRPPEGEEPDPYRSLGARVAAFPEPEAGMTPPPLEWSEIPLAVAGAETEAPIVLAPGATTRVHTRPWVPAVKERHFAQAVFAFYGKPPEGGPPMIRGRALSDVVEIE